MATTLSFRGTQPRSTCRGLCQHACDRSEYVGRFPADQPSALLTQQTEVRMVGCMKRSVSSPGPRRRSSMRIVAALALLVCAACAADGPAAPAAQTSSADSAFVTALRARLEAATQTGEFSGAVLVVRDGR